MQLLSDKQLIINHILFHAYFCHLIETGLSISVKKLVEISHKYDEEIKLRKITDVQIKNCILTAELSFDDQQLIANHIYSNFDFINKKIYS